MYAGSSGHPLKFPIDGWLNTCMLIVQYWGEPNRADGNVHVQAAVGEQVASRGWVVLEEWAAVMKVVAQCLSQQEHCMQPCVGYLLASHTPEELSVIGDQCEIG